ncbi:MAG: SDR family NAD(P)-dependent oxidoreductase [Deltaproteobacteria bacterium]|nr:SDR family NAD(P)-dependent oxidoreductase [Deltaproteobacteria bacterium]
MYSFHKKNVLVTGASGGIGSPLVRLLAKAGADLVISSRSMKALEGLISSLLDSTRAVPIAADLSRPGEAHRLAIEAIESAGRIDVLFNIAGIGYFALMEEATEENLRRLFEVNMFSPVVLIRALLPRMKSRGEGRIINIVSCAGRVPIPSVGVYGGSKSALAVMTNTMRLELDASGIDIINIYPGTADTSFEENALRERDRPGLCPRDHCGVPRTEIAGKIFDASAGPPGEVWLERPGKWMAIGALAWPGLIERRLAPLVKKVVVSKSVRQRRWRLLQVESSIACNLRCVMCPWKDMAKNAANRGIMSQRVWAAIRPHLPETQVVDFTGGGEPLLQPRLAEWISEASNAGCETGILTNGLLLKRETAQKLIDAGLTMICVSMDGATPDIYHQIRLGSNFDRVCENLAQLAAIRKGKVPRTSINFVLMPMNFHQVEDMVRLAAKLGVDQVNFKQCDVIRGEHGKGYGLFGSEETREIRRLEKALARARKMAKKLKIETTAFSFTPDELPVCEQDPRNSVFIRYDGAVGPCINLAIGGPTTFLGKDVTMPVIHYGSLPEQDLLTLWETEKCRFYRERFEQRVKAHEQSMVNTLLSSSPNRQRALESARKSMPDAPEGCKVCHYLYGI